MILNEVATYKYPDYACEFRVLGSYENWKKLYMDEPESYTVVNEDGEHMDEPNTIWTRIPTRKEVRNRYVEITYS